jgi:hypothetical protein
MQPRYAGRRRGVHWIVWLIPVVLLCCVGTLMLAPAVPGLLLRVVGFQPRGSVETFWEEQITAQPPVAVNAVGVPPASPAAADASTTGSTSPTPTPVILGSGTGGGSAVDQQSDGTSASSQYIEYPAWFQSASTPPVLNVNSSRGSFTVNTGESYAAGVQVGPAVDGYPIGVIDYRESALDGICRTWLAGCATDQFQVSAVDFRPNGAIVYGSANVAGLSQDAGVILTLAADMKHFTAQGLVLGGQVYAVPAEGDIADFVQRAVAEGNAALEQVNVQAGGYNLSLVQIQITDDQLVLVLR